MTPDIPKYMLKNVMIRVKAMVVDFQKICYTI